MANYLPPSEDLPIFDNSVFEVNNAPLTYSEAVKGFLTFPFAQGNETFQDIIVDGTTEFYNQVDNFATMPSSIDSSSIVPTTAWVQSAITGAPTNTDIDVTTATTAGPFYMPMITGSTTGAYAGYIDNGMSYNASTNNLTTTTFTGDLVGNASTVTIFISNVGNTIASSINQDSNLGLTFTNNQQSRLTTFISPGGTAPFSLGVNTGLAGLSIGWNKTNGNGESDFVNYGQGGVGGFNFYNGSSTIPMSLIAQIPNTQPTSIDSTNILATTAFVQSRITTFLSSANVYSGGVGGPQSMGVLQLFSGTLLSPNVWQFTSAIQASSVPQNNLRLNMGGNQSLSFQGLSSLNTAISSVNGVSFGNLTGNTQIQNYANTGVTPGFTFSSVTNVATAKILGILAYNKPSANESSNILATTEWVQDAIGAITQVPITPNGNNATHYLTFSDTNTAGNINLHTNAGIQVNPSTDTITATTFSGALSGNASTATTAATSQTVSLTTDNTNGSYYIPFSKTTTATSNALYIDPITSPLTYNPSSGRLTTFSLQCNNGGNVLFDSDTTLYPLTTGLIEQLPNILNIYPSLTGSSSLFINGAGSPVVPVGTIPTNYGVTNSGLRIGWNSSGGNGESEFINYGGVAGAGAGGFAFYSGSVANSIELIGVIPRTQLGYGDSSAFYLPTYDWVNGTITDAIGALPGGEALLAGGSAMVNQIFTGWNTFSNLITTSGSINSTSTTPILSSATYPVYPTITNTALTTSQYVVSLINSLATPIAGTTPFILYFGNNNGNGTGGTDFYFNPNFTAHLSTTGWSNPSAGHYTVTMQYNLNFGQLRNVTLSGNNTPNAGQRPQMVVNVVYNPLIYPTSTVDIYVETMAGQSNGGVFANSAFSYSVIATYY